MLTAKPARIRVASRRESWPQQGLLNVPSSQRQNHFTEIIEFFRQMFHQLFPTKQFSQATKPFSVFEQTSGNSRWLSVTNETAHSATA
jgi:hypothetical protein